ncbi:hypothetical protein HK102_002176, partial [Quaeritorhiza haematococci]
LREPQLVALQLGKDDSVKLNNPQLLAPVAEYCRPLEYLSISLSLTPDKATSSIEEDLVHFVQQCGRTLRYFALYLSSYEDEDEEGDPDDADGNDEL